MAALTGGLAAVAAVAGFIVWRALAPELQPAGLDEPATTTDLRLTRLETPKPIPPLSFAKGDGQTTRLADFHGRVVLLNIWATWCVPCRKEMPTLDRLQSNLGGKDFEVVALSIDRRGREVVEPFYEELGLHALGIYLDQSGDAPHKLNTVGVPTTLLIDRDGREVARKVGPAEWDSPEMIAVIRDTLDRPRTERSP
jgi:thiol-disulfide isomerase/thioredoxin